MTYSVNADVFTLAAHNWMTVAELHAEHGAADTEPRCVFVQLIADALDGREAHIPGTAAGWELYDIDADADAAAVAARNLAVAAAVAINVVHTDDTTRAAAAAWLGR